MSGIKHHKKGKIWIEPAKSMLIILALRFRVNKQLADIYGYLNFVLI